MAMGNIIHIIFLLLMMHGYVHGQQQTAISSVVSLPTEEIGTYSPNDNYRLIMEATDVSVRDPYGAVPLMEHATRISLQQHDYNNAFQGYFSLAAIQTSIGDYKSAEVSYRKALYFSYKTDKPVANLCRALNNLGNTYIFQCDYTRASKYYFRAAELAARNTANNMETADQLIRIYNNLGAALMQLDRYQAAIYYLNRSDSLNKIIRSEERFSVLYSNKAAVYNKLHMPDNAWQYAQLSLDFARRYHKFHDEFSALINMATILISTGEPARAIRYMDTAFAIKGNIFPYYRAEALYLAGQAYYMLNDVDNAEKYFLLGKQIAQNTNATNYLFRIHQQLALLYARSRKFEQAFDHMQTAYVLNDSVLNKEKTEAVNLLEVKYRTAEKDKELAQKQLQIKSQERHLEQKNLWIYTTTGGVLVLAVLLAALYKNYQHKQRLQEHRIRILQQRQELLHREQEINTLKAMMLGGEQERTRISQDLHDGVGSTLAAVKMNFTAVQNDYPQLAQDDKFSEAMSRLDDMYYELRQASHNLTPEFLLRHGLPDAVSLYCEQIQKGRKLSITFQSYGSFSELSTDFSLTVYRIIQELVHNIVKHAHATQALLQLYHHDHLLSVNIEDNGIGFRPEDAKGLGLTNLQRRVNSLNGRLQLESSEKGSSFFLEFDLDETQYTRGTSLVNQIKP